MEIIGKAVDPKGVCSWAENSVDFVHRSVMLHVYSELGQEKINELSREELEDAIINCFASKHHIAIDLDYEYELIRSIAIMLLPCGRGADLYGNDDEVEQA